jgi:outer membrane protein OmpA-like peptidoglycan-associated protein
VHRPGSEVFILQFGYRESAIDLAEESAMRLVEAVRDAGLVLVRGRTDGVVETAGESRVARERADAVREYLVALGVPTDRIRTTYQPIGDYIADNSTEKGRALNRRAEVEVYHSAPMQLVLTAKIQ